MLENGTLAKRTIYQDGSLFEIYYPDGSNYFGSIKDIGNYMSANDIEPKEGYMLYPDGTMKMGEWEKGHLKKLQFSIKFKMTDAVLEYVKGLAQHRFQKYADAIKSFNTAASKNCKEDSLSIYRGIAYYNIAKYDSAITDFGTFLKKFKKSKKALDFRSKTFFAKKDTASGLADMDTYIKLYPKDSSGYWQRGIIHHNLKEYSKAIADYTKALEYTKGKSENVYYYRAVCYELLGKLTEACADYTIAKERGKKEAGAKVDKLCKQGTSGSGN